MVFLLGIRYASVAQLDRASDYGSEGCGFDSCQVRQIKCLSGGIGRRTRLKIWNSSECAGSSPASGTIEISKLKEILKSLIFLLFVK